MEDHSQLHKDLLCKNRSLVIGERGTNLLVPVPKPNTLTHTNTRKEARWNIGVARAEHTTPQLFLSPNLQGEHDLRGE